MPFRSRSLGERAGARLGLITVQIGPINAAAVDTTGDATFFICPPDVNLELIRCLAVHTNIGSASASCNVMKCTGTQAPSAGVAMLATVIDLIGVAANNVRDKGLTTTIADRRLAPNDRVCGNFAGTLTNLAGLCIVLQFLPIVQGDILYWRKPD